MTTSVPAEIFRAYDIRGIVGATLTAPVVRAIGQALGTLALEAGGTTIAIGRDGRLSGPELAAALAEPRLSACVIGPGAGRGEATRAAALAMLGSGRPVVLDADALTSLTGDLPLPGRAVLTPHAGEFCALFPDQPDAPAAARAAGQVVVLKGPRSVIAAPDGRAAINGNAPRWLATAGSGDVLAGVIGGLLAQGMPCFEAACAGVWLHGAAGVAAGANLTAEDLEPALRRVLVSRAGF
jgi:hydroxyethylthiazole kinase-like uncharacterized protein yjeF